MKNIALLLCICISLLFGESLCMKDNASNNTNVARYLTVDLPSIHQTFSSASRSVTNVTAPASATTIANMAKNGDFPLLIKRESFCHKYCSKIVSWGSAIIVFGALATGFATLCNDGYSLFCAGPPL
ncbi:hypothetical protein FACS1894122_06320 [Alphaproteobacteria bacterium]|nr:hypothetical protein FACS1894122_06320 [Alphaproteobacteria bacterium]